MTRHSIGEEELLALMQGQIVHLDHCSLMLEDIGFEAMKRCVEKATSYGEVRLFGLKVYMNPELAPDWWRFDEQ